MLLLNTILWLEFLLELNVLLNVGVSFVLLYGIIAIAGVCRDVYEYINILEKNINHFRYLFFSFNFKILREKIYARFIPAINVNTTTTTLVLRSYKTCQSKLDII